MMRFGSHLLASERGYRTVASSPEITPRERAALEPLVFGQSADAAFLASLERDPAGFVRMLPADAGAQPRVALTRVFAGRPDEAGRATLELRSLLTSLDDYERLARCNLERVLGEESLWRREHFDSGRTIACPDPAPPHRAAVGRNELLMMDAWLRTLERPSSAAVLADGAEARRVLFSFLRVLSREDLARCRWGVRLLSLAVGAQIATAPPTLERASHELIPIDLRARPAHPAISFLLESQGMMERLPPSERLRQGLIGAADAPRPSVAELGASGGTSATLGRAGEARSARRSITPALAVTLVGALAVITAVAVIVISRARGPSSTPVPPPPAPPPAPVHESTTALAPDGSAEKPVGSSPPPGRSSAPSNESTPSAERASRPPAGAATAPPETPPPDPSAKPPPEPSAEPGIPPPNPGMEPSAEPPSPTAPSPEPSPRDEPDDAAILDAIGREERAAAEAFTDLVARTRELQGALEGPDEDRGWGDGPSRWSAPHCDAVAKAVERLDEALNLLPAIFGAEWIARVARPPADAPAFADCAELRGSLPRLAGAAASLRDMAREEFRNALVTRDRAAEAVRRSDCRDERLARAVDEHRALGERLRTLTRSAVRNDRAAISGTAARLRASLERQAGACGRELAPELRAACSVILDGLGSVQSGDSR